jgi:hypothetical protein
MLGLMAEATEVWVVDWVNNEKTTENGKTVVISDARTSDWFRSDGLFSAREKAEAFAQRQQGAHPENQYKPRKLTD